MKFLFIFLARPWTAFLCISCLLHQLLHHSLSPPILPGHPCSRALQLPAHWLLLLPLPQGLCTATRSWGPGRAALRFATRLEREAGSLRNKSKGRDMTRPSCSVLREKRGSLLTCPAPGTHSSNVICTSEHPRLAWHWEIKEFYRIFKEGQAAWEAACGPISELAGRGQRVCGSRSEGHLSHTWQDQPGTGTHPARAVGWPSHSFLCWAVLCTQEWTPAPKEQPPHQAGREVQRAGWKALSVWRALREEK